MQASPVAGMVPAGFWIRFGAYVIDALLLSVVLWPLGLAGNSIMTSLVFFIYQTAMHAMKGQTVGKMLLGLKVVTTYGQQLDWGKSALRSVGWIVSGFILGIGFFTAGFDEPQKRALA